MQNCCGCFIVTFHAVAGAIADELHHESFFFFQKLILQNMGVYFFETKLLGLQIFFAHRPIMMLQIAIVIVSDWVGTLFFIRN